jgi:outer membrane protein assembly factor BamB
MKPRWLLQRRLWRSLLALIAALAAIVSVAAVRPAAAPSKPGAASAATDWPQWRGPERTGISTETGWRTDWTANPPKVLWKKAVGQGFSSVAVSKGRVYTMGNSGNVDTVFCFKADTGAEVWKHTYPCEGGDNPGPRSTPTVDGASVYTLSRAGDLFCLNAETGKVKWQMNVSRQLGVQSGSMGHGFTCSPLVLDNALVMDLGPTVALDKSSGQLIWRSGNDKAAYSSPYAFKLGSVSHSAVFNEFGPVVLNASNGKEVGRARWETTGGTNVATPIVQGSALFISSAFGVGGAVFEITDTGLKPVWRNKNMSNCTSTCVLYNGCLYGFDGQVNEGPLACVDFKTGEKKWAEASMKAGDLMLADGKLIFMNARGELGVAEATPAGYKELGRTQVLSGTCWTMPVLSGGRIYCRNQPGDLVCLDVRGK